MIYLTGGTGLLGLHIIDELRDQGERVVALARSDHAAATLSRRGAEPREGEVTDRVGWERLVDGRAIVHAAAVIAGPAHWSEYERVNVGGTRLAVETALRLAVPLIHISSVAVYGDGAGDRAPGTVAEDHPTGSRSGGEYYARSKRLAEDAVQEGMARGLRAVLLRPCVVYGEGDRLFLPNVVRFARLGLFPLVGSGTEPLAIVEARNVAAAVTAALRCRDGWGRAYNIANDDEITGEDFVAALAEGLGRRIRSIRIPVPLAATLAGGADLLRSLGRSRAPGFRSAVRFLRGGNPFTSDAARARLGWRPRRRHREILPRVVRGF